MFLMKFFLHRLTDSKTLSDGGTGYFFNHLKNTIHWSPHISFSDWPGVQRCKTRVWILFSFFTQLLLSLNTKWDIKNAFVHYSHLYDSSLKDKPVFRVEAYMSSITLTSTASLLPAWTYFTNKGKQRRNYVATAFGRSWMFIQNKI